MNILSYLSACLKTFSFHRHRVKVTVNNTTDTRVYSGSQGEGETLDLSVGVTHSTSSSTVLESTNLMDSTASGNYEDSSNSVDSEDSVNSVASADSSSSVEESAQMNRAQEKSIYSFLSDCAVVWTSDRDMEDKTCLICYEEFKRKDRLVTMTCMHMFHHGCSIEWFTKKGFVECPLCRGE